MSLDNLDYMAPHRAKVTPRFPAYTGTKTWKVKHPDHGEVTVVAPSIPAAIATAASVWNRRWQEYGFYSECEVITQKAEKAVRR